MLALLSFLVTTHLVAAVPFGLVVTTLWGGDVDLRAVGSGNIGATNVLRAFGPRVAAPVFALDIAKGLVPVLLARLLWPELGIWWPSVVALNAFVGHCFSVFLEFRGGKGVATGAGGMLGLAPLPTLLAATTWAAVFAATGRSSVSALVATTVLLPLGMWLTPAAVPAMLVLAAGIFLTHVANIGRLVRGEETPVIRPVRWTRQTDDKVESERALTKAPSGEDVDVPVWKDEEE